MTIDWTAGNEEALWRNQIAQMIAECEAHLKKLPKDSRDYAEWWVRKVGLEQLLGAVAIRRDYPNMRRATFPEVGFE